MRIEIPQGAEEIVNRLNKEGYEAFVVGGCVRDSLMGRTPEDWDITTSALPAQVKALFGRTIDTGIQHGTVTVMKNRVGYEVTTYRIDGEYQDGRHPKSVSFTSSLREDLRRRDFTINAMAYSPQTGLVDLFDGLGDLKAGIIRCVGNPVDRFSEDALRILRAIRFSAQLGFAIEEETEKAIALIGPNLKKVSRERVQAELTKLLLSPNPEKISKIYEDGISSFISARIHELAGRKLALTGELPPKKHVRWAVFLKDGGKEKAGASLKELKMDNDTIQKVKTLVSWIDRPPSPEEKAMRKAMSQMEPSLFKDLLAIWQVLNLPEIHERKRIADLIWNRGDCLYLKDLAVGGNDLIQAGIRPGKELGSLLKSLLSQVLDSPELNQKEILLSLVDKEKN
ncbi:MAG TPA: CCA tRNA nucleotidyltransferase [Candidatus Cottocaccamicrobium excrementipullorum]|nr:CCA tRNA nucleotidyltransferase [Candidatus Cottocaccamicrobium excrementipullorum]